MISHYGIDCEGCGLFTASGTIPTENRTIATDWNVIPAGTEVLINGKIYIAEDKGGAIKGNRIDMFVGTEELANELGIYEIEVFVKE